MQNDSTGSTQRYYQVEESGSTIQFEALEECTTGSESRQKRMEDPHCHISHGECHIITGNTYIIKPMQQLHQQRNPVRGLLKQYTTGKINNAYIINHQTPTSYEEGTTESVVRRDRSCSIHPSNRSSRKSSVFLNSTQGNCHRP